MKEFSNCDIENAEAQAIAEGISVCQQKNWKPEWPIFIFRFIGLRIIIYKAIFSNIFLEKIRKGHKGMEITNVEKYFVTDDFMREGLYLMNPLHREKFVLILASLGEYIKNILK